MLSVAIPSHKKRDIKDVKKDFYQNILVPVDVIMLYRGRN